MLLSEFAKPLSFEPGREYFRSLESHVRRFQSAAVEEIAKHEDEDNIVLLSKIRTSLNTQVQACVELLGYVRLANDSAIQMLLLSMFESLSKAGSRNSLVQEIKRGDGPFYRIRRDMGAVKSIKDKDRKAIFHVPIQLQHKVRQTRYSSDGVTSLYLATTIATAIKECGQVKYLLPKQRIKADVDYCNLAAFKARRDLLLLDLSLDGDLDRQISGKEDLLIWLGELLTLPLRLLCHTTFINSGDRGDASYGYQLYYVIPNAIAKLVMQKEIMSFSTSATPLVGIQYSSVQAFGEDRGLNCVLFPSYPNLRNDNEWSDGHCKKLEDLILGNVYQISARELGRISDLTSNFVKPDHYDSIEEMLFAKVPLKPDNIPIS